MDIWGRNIPGQGESWYRDPEVRSPLMYSEGKQAVQDGLNHEEGWGESRKQGQKGSQQTGAKTEQVNKLRTFSNCQRGKVQAIRKPR